MADSAVRPVFINVGKYINSGRLESVFAEVQKLHDRMLAEVEAVPSTALIAMMRISLQAMRSREEVCGDLTKHAELFFAEQEAIALAFEEQRVLHERKASEAARKREARAAKRKQRALEQLGTSDPDAPVDEESASDQPARKRRARPRLEAEDTPGTWLPLSHPSYPEPSVLLSPPSPK